LLVVLPFTQFLVEQVYVIADTVFVEELIDLSVVNAV